MPGFVRQHLRPLAGAVGLHLLLFALIVATAWRWSSTRPPVPMAIEGVAIDDPEGRLEGGGSQVRSIRLDDRAAILDDPYIRGLMTQALRVAGANLKSGVGQIVFKSRIGS